MPNTSESRPEKITVCAYQVGFGDCFLLTFHYPEGDSNGKQHILIDFGSTESPTGKLKRSAMLRSIADDIKSRCGGKLRAVVATHRHADHINGFGKGSGEIIAKCQPDFVLQPWTEDPAAAADALGPAGSQAQAGPLALYGRPEDRRAFLGALHETHAFADLVRNELQSLQERKGCARDVIEHLRLLSLNNRGWKDPANKAAIDNLTTMGKKGRALYLSYGQGSQLDDLLPGVKVHVLGPPTLSQSQEISRQRSSDADEFWQFHVQGAKSSWLRLAGAMPRTGGPAALFDSPATVASQWAPQYARWFVRRMSSLRSEQLLELVRILDGALNNTSLILLFEAGDQKLLFPGDAQLENWSYALKHPAEQADNEKLLRQVTLYKVGHHGSRNATPKSLWNLIKKDGLRCLVSTKAGRHGRANHNTEVPRESLVAELQKYDYHSTQGLEWTQAGPPPVLDLSPIVPKYESATPDG